MVRSSVSVTIATRFAFTAAASLASSSKSADGCGRHPAHPVSPLSTPAHLEERLLAVALADPESRAGPRREVLVVPLDALLEHLLAVDVELDAAARDDHDHPVPGGVGERVPHVDDVAPAAERVEESDATPACVTLDGQPPATASPRVTHVHTHGAWL